MLLMEMADTPKLDLASSGETGTLMEDNNMETQKIISVVDHISGLQYTPEKSESFVVDVESLYHGTTTTITNKDVVNNNNNNSRISLQKSLSRKGSLRGNDKNINSPKKTTPKDATFSPRGPSKPEKLPVGTNLDGSCNPQVHHQITVTATNIYATAEGRCTSRRNSFKRYSIPWVLDPKRVLFFFATLSSIGTLLLIFFTLSIGKLNTEDSTI